MWEGMVFDHAPSVKQPVACGMPGGGAALRDRAYAAKLLAIDRADWDQGAGRLCFWDYRLRRSSLPDSLDMLRWTTPLRSV